MQHVKRKYWRALQIVTIATVVALAMTARTHAAGLKQFSDFPATETFKGKVSALSAKAAPEQWSAVRKVEKDIIREEIAGGPNFAGAYYLATVGCGTNCDAIFVVDLRNGSIYAAPESASNGVFFQKDSRLIIIKENKDYDLPRAYLVFEQGKFQTFK